MEKETTSPEKALRDKILEQLHGATVHMAKHALRLAEQSLDGNAYLRTVEDSRSTIKS